MSKTESLVAQVAALATGIAGDVGGIIDHNAILRRQIAAIALMAKQGLAKGGKPRAMLDEILVRATNTLKAAECMEGK